MDLDEGPSAHVLCLGYKTGISSHAVLTWLGAADALVPLEKLTEATRRPVCESSWLST